MNFYKFLTEGHEPMFRFPYKNIKIFWNTGQESGEHTLQSRLDRINKTKNEVYQELKKFIDVLKKEDRKYGVYAVIFNQFKMIATYSKNRIFINTFLSKNMKETNYDFRLQVLEAIEKFTGEKFEENTFTIVNMLKETICVEKGEDYLDLYGIKNSVFDIIEID